MMTKALLLFAALVGSLAPTTAFVPSHPSTIVFKKTVQSSYLSFLPNKQATFSSTSSKTSASSLLAQKTELDNIPSSLGPSAFFLVFAAMLGKLFFEIQDSTLPTTIGTASLLIVTAAVGYDNLIIGLGANVFANAREDDNVREALKWLSYPRFVLHAVAVPFLYVTAAEIGKAAGVEWLQGDLIQNGIPVASAALAIISRVRFFQSPGIELENFDDGKTPEDALERELLWFTYKEPEFLYVVPSIILAFWNIAVGVGAFRLDEADAHAAGLWLIASAVGVLTGNAMKSYVARFTGNLAEVVMLWCVFEAALRVL